MSTGIYHSYEFLTVLDELYLFHWQVLSVKLSTPSRDAEVQQYQCRVTKCPEEQVPLQEPNPRHTVRPGSNRHVPHTLTIVYGAYCICTSRQIRSDHIGTDLGTRKGSVQVGQIADCAVTKSWEHWCSSYQLHDITRQSGIWPALLATPRLLLREGDQTSKKIFYNVFQLLLKNLSPTLKPRHKAPIG